MAEHVQLSSNEAGALPQAALRSRPHSTQIDFLLRLLSQGKATFGMSILIFFFLVALFADVIAPGDPTRFVGRRHEAPSAQHWLGTTGQGQDVFTQLVRGSRVSLLIGFSVGLMITLIGLVIGMVAGYLHGWVDNLLNIFTNIFLIIPSLPLLLILASFLSPGTATIILVLTLTSWAWPARVFRSQTLTLCEKDFVSASLVSGEKTLRIVFSEILPNMMSLVISSFFGNVVYAIGADVGLAFLGFEDINTVSWGTMLYWAQNNSALLQSAWWTFVPPGLCVALVAFATTMMIYAVDEVTNPRLKSEKEITRVLKKFNVASRRATPVIKKHVA
jgi:peptide/nickel transport system permease protein